MENTILGLNYWAWLGFVFLALAGFCSAMATKHSTSNIVERGVDSTLVGTQIQLSDAVIKITHPVQDLYDYLINKHKSIHDDYLNQTALQLYMNEMLTKKEEGIEIASGGEQISITQLRFKIKQLSDPVTDLQNSLGSSIYTIKLLAQHVENESIFLLVEEYNKAYEVLVRDRQKALDNEGSFAKVNKSMGKLNSIYSGIIEMSSDYKSDVYAQTNQGY